MNKILTSAGFCKILDFKRTPNPLIFLLAEAEHKNLMLQIDRGTRQLHKNKPPDSCM